VIQARSPKVTGRTGNSSKSSVRQTAIFDPRGLFEPLYWYALYPVCQWVFAGMLRGIVRVCHTGELGTGDSCVTSKCTQEP
jgi:hypothetical protein